MALVRHGAEPPDPAWVDVGLAELAEAHRLGAFVAPAPARASDAAWKLRCRSELAELAETLVDIPFAVIKGPVVASAYADEFLRPYGDVDVLVAPEVAQSVCERLASRGASVPRTLPQSGPKQVTVVLPRGTHVDLHWDVINDPSLRRSFRFPTLEMLGRTRTITALGLELPTLDATDTLLHLCTHAALSGGHLLGWYVDLDRVVRRDGIEVESLVARSRRYGVGLLTAVLLDRSARWLGTPLPAGLVTRLGGRSPWLFAGRQLDRIAPPGGRAGRRVHGQAFFRSLRGTGLESARGAAWMLRTVLTARHDPGD